MANKKLWGGRFKKKTSKEVEAFTSSTDVDKRFYKHDILGSIAHAKALWRAGVITAQELKKMARGLEEILKGLNSGKLKLKGEFEDVHMNIEKMLIGKIGNAGKKLHTGRSRNDQVVTDLRMYHKDEVVETTCEVCILDAEELESTIRQDIRQETAYDLLGALVLIVLEVREPVLHCGGERRVELDVETTRRRVVVRRKRDRLRPTACLA